VLEVVEEVLEDLVKMQIVLQILQEPEERESLQHW
jgi:hypothetical protein